MSVASNQIVSALKNLENQISKISESVGVNLYDLEWTKGPQGQILRVYIDKEGGVGIEDCSNVSRGLGEILDAQDPFEGVSYSLEVSSPGVERHLTKKWHFEKIVGQEVAFKFKAPLEKFGCTLQAFKLGKNLTLKVDSVNDESVQIDLGAEKIVVPFDQIEKAKLAFNFKQNKSEKPGHTNKGHKK